MKKLPAEACWTSGGSTGSGCETLYFSALNQRDNFSGILKEALDKWRLCPLKCCFSAETMSPAVHMLNSWGSRGDLDLLKAVFPISLENLLIFNWPGQLLYQLCSCSSCLKCQLNSWAYNCFLFTLGKKIWTFKFYSMEAHTSSL